MKTIQLFSSATPFTRVSEARCFAVSTRVKHDYGILEDVPLVDEHWSEFARQICGPHIDPIDYSPAAMERLVKKLDPFIVQMKNVRSKFHARNSIQIIQFRTEEERLFYDQAWQRFLAEKAQIEGAEGLSAAQTRMMILVQFLKFRQAAELIRAPFIAEFLVDCWSKGQAGAAAVCFKETINKICWELINNFGWTRDDVSIIWGGNINQKNKKKDLQRNLQDNAAAMEALKAAGISLEDLGLDYDEEELKTKSEEQKAFERAQRLGPQNFKERQREIDRFQYQKSKCCLFTFKSGGVGLSLHHQFPGARQRVCILTPTYSAMELVQGLGRCPRLTSLSDTPQLLCFYGGTIEVDVAARVSMKLKCLTKVVRQRESWEDVIIGAKYRQQENEEDAEDIDEALGGTYIEDSEDEDNNNDTKTDSPSS